MCGLSGTDDANECERSVGLQRWVEKMNDNKRSNEGGAKGGNGHRLFCWLQKRKEGRRRRCENSYIERVDVLLHVREDGQGAAGRLTDVLGVAAQDAQSQSVPSEATCQSHIRRQGSRAAAGCRGLWVSVRIAGVSRVPEQRLARVRRRKMALLWTCTRSAQEEASPVGALSRQGFGVNSDGNEGLDTPKLTLLALLGQWRRRNGPRRPTGSCFCA